MFPWRYRFGAKSVCDLFDHYKSKLVRDAVGAEFYAFELDVVGVAFEGDLADKGGEQLFVLAFVGPVG